MRRVSWLLGVMFVLLPSCSSTVERDFIHCEPARTPTCADQPYPDLNRCKQPLSVEGPRPHRGQCCFLVTVEETTRVPSSRSESCALGD